MDQTDSISPIPNKFWSHCVMAFQNNQHLADFLSPVAPFTNTDYRQVSNIRRTLVGNQIVDHSDVVAASPVGAAPTTSSFST